jgi:hypothetical protein
MFYEGPTHRVTFSPTDAHPVDFEASLAYVADLMGRRIAFVQDYYMRTSDSTAKHLRSGQVGRLEIAYTGDERPAERLVIPVGVLTCIGHISKINDVVVETFVIAEVA